jgi:transmembrane 6 superfamily
VEEETALFLIALSICTSIALLSALLLRRLNDIFAALFSLFAFTCVVDLLLALNIDGHLDWLSYYLSEGERYLLTPFGAAINYYDGSVHYVFYLLLIHGIVSSRQSYWHRAVGLLFVGSVLNSLTVFLPGNVFGRFGDELKLSFLLNVPYVLVPLLYLRRLANEHAVGAHAVDRRRGSSIGANVSAAVLLVFCAFQSVVWFARLGVVLHAPSDVFARYAALVEPNLLDTTHYPTMQALFDFFVRGPLHLVAARALLWRAETPSWLLDALYLNVGAAAQGQFAQVFAALDARSAPFAVAADGIGRLGFVGIQLPLALLPLLMLLYFHSISDRRHKKIKQK